MHWLIEGSAFGEVEAFNARAAEVPTLEAAGRGPANVLSLEGGTGSIRVEGILTPDGSRVLDFFGVPNTSYASIQSAVLAADANPDVERIEFLVNSPGGRVDGLFPTLEAIRGASKPTRTLASSASSAAYAIAASTGGIEAVGRESSFGSIGVVASFAKDDGAVHVTSTNAPDKRPDVNTPEGKAVVREQLDAIHDLFVGAISEGRNISPAVINETFGRGKTFLAEESRQRGMIEGIRVAQRDTAPTNTTAQATLEKKKMDLETIKSTHPHLCAAIHAEGKVDGVASERDRVRGHLKMGEASGAMDTAIKAACEGSAMTQELQADYMSAGILRRVESQRKEEDADAAAALDGKAPAGAESDAWGDEFAAEMNRLNGSLI